MGFVEYFAEKKEKNVLSEMIKLYIYRSVYRSTLQNGRTNIKMDRNKRRRAVHHALIFQKQKYIYILK